VGLSNNEYLADVPGFIDREAGFGLTKGDTFVFEGGEDGLGGGGRFVIYEERALKIKRIVAEWPWGLRGRKDTWLGRDFLFWSHNWSILFLSFLPLDFFNLLFLS
jgi:hypothetical protein